jgi:hypothetical protein
MGNPGEQRPKNGKQMKTLIKKRIQHFARFSAQKLNAKASVLSPLKMKLALFLFCILFSGFSTYIIMEAIASRSDRASSVFVKSARIPLHIGRTNIITINPTFSPADFNRVEFIKKYLDSLSANDKKEYIGIIQLRPHLLDSIQLLETFYLQNLKK